MSPHQDLSQRSSSHHNRGFTLVEVLVALTLLTTALVPAFVLASNAVNLSVRIKNSLTAADLAQEGVEVVRAIRDDNWFAEEAAPLEANGLSECDTAAGCQVQWDSPQMEKLSGNPFLKIDPATGLYQYGPSGAPDSIFHRKITITEVVPGIEVAVISKVEWMEHGKPKEVSIEYHLFNWLQ